MKLAIVLLLAVAAIAAPTNKPAECSACKWIVGEAERWITETSTEQEIAKAVANVCKFVPATLRTNCVDFVKEYTPQLIELLVKRVSAEKICSALGFCTNAFEDANSLQCAVCVWIMDEIEGWLTDETTEAEIVHKLESLCKLLPRTVQDSCNVLIEQYVPELLQLLVDEVSPQVICQKLGICPKMPEKTVDGAVECAACKYVLGEIEKWISENSTEQQIIHAVERICDHVPGALRPTCQAFIESYGPLVIEVILQRLEPSVVCSKLHLCPAARVEENSIQCAVCEWVITEVANLLERNSTVAQIEKVLQKVCGFLPAAIRAPCEQFIAEYTPILIELLVKEVAPEKICTIIGLCGKTLVAKPVECAVCKWFVDELKKFLVDPKTEKDLEALLDRLCLLLPGSVKGLCTAFVGTYGPVIIEMLAQKVDPDKICQAVRLC